VISLNNIRPTVVTDLEVARERWNALNSVNVASSPFTDFELTLALAQSFGWQLTPVFWGEHLGACFLVRSRAWATDIVVPPFAPYSCIALSESIPEAERPEFLERIFDDVEGLPYSRVISLDPRLCFSESRPDTYACAPKQTFSIPTSPLEKAISAFSESTRRQFNRSKEDLIFQTNNLSVSNLCEMVAAGYEHHGRRAPLSREKMEAMAAAVSGFTLARQLGIFDVRTNELQAGIVLLLNNTTAWYWLAGSERGPAMTVLLAHTIHFLHEQNVGHFDLMGANTDGISEFKRRFGGILIQYRHWQRLNWSNRFVSVLGQFKRLVRSL